MGPVRRLFRLALHRKREAALDVDEEIHFHLDMRTEQMLARGLTAEEARAAALRRFGDLEAARGRLRNGAERREARMLRRERLSALGQDLSYAGRQLRRSPGFAAAAVASMALAIAANATMFGIVDRLLLRPPAYLADPAHTHRLFLARQREGKEFTGSNISYKRYRDLADSARTIAAAAAFFSEETVVGTGDEARQRRVGLVSASFWRMFDAPPVLGRVFGEAEDRTPSGAAVAVLGHAFWQAQYGGSADVLGHQIRIGNLRYTIVGVAPEGFNGMSQFAIAAYVPITTAAHSDFGDEYFTGHNISWMEMMVRRRPDVSAQAVQAEMTARYRASVLATPTHPPLDVMRPRAIVASTIFERGPRRGQEARVSLWLGGVAVVVLLVACANVANLLLARTRRRAREIAVRVALGIGRGRLIAQLLTESVLLGVLGGLAGLALAHWGGGVLRTLLMPDVDWGSGMVDWRLLAATTAAAVGAGLLAGLAPALQSSRPDVNRVLKAGGREGSAARSGTRAALLALQVALSLVLLVGAGLFGRSLHNVHGVDLGFDPGRVLFVRADVTREQMSATERRALLTRVRERALALPQVERATFTRSVPFYMTWDADLTVPGIDSVSRLGEFSTNAVSPDYFATVGTRVLRGRGITDADRDGGQLATVVDEAMARALWPGTDPIGKCLKVGADTAPCTLVVGVSQDVRRDNFDTPAMEYYLAAAQRPEPPSGVFVRTRGDARRVAEQVRRELQHVAPADIYIDARPLQDIVDPGLRPWRLGATMFSVFGGLALLLAAVGLYGVIAFNVTQRTHELGVRMALGARAGDILRLIVGDGVRVTLVGIAVGTAVALLVGRYAAPLLFRVSPRDPLTMLGVALTLLAVAVAASLVPARRAARTDPNVALRAE